MRFHTAVVVAVTWGAMAPSAVAAVDCTSIVTVIGVGGTSTATLYWDDRDEDGQLTGNDFIYQESGVREGLQRGTTPINIVEPAWQPDRCLWPVRAERDLMLY